MNEFLIGERLRIHHYADWSGSAFLNFDDAEHRIPGEAAKILVHMIRKLERDSSHLHRRELACVSCNARAGVAWFHGDDKDPVQHALCSACCDRVKGS